MKRYNKYIRNKNKAQSNAHKTYNHVRNRLYDIQQYILWVKHQISHLIQTKGYSEAAKEFTFKRLNDNLIKARKELIDLNAKAKTCKNKMSSYNRECQIEYANKRKTTIFQLSLF